MDKKSTSRGGFSGSLGFVLAAAGSAVGLGNIWRFPYLAAKDGGGIFLLVYLILALTFGFALLTTEIAIGRKTGKSSLAAYGLIDRRMKWIGPVSGVIPALILPYYCVIGGWILKFLSLYITGAGNMAVENGYFGSFIGSLTSPLIWFIIYILATAIIVIKGVDKGIEKFSKVLMPILIILIFAISIFSLTLSHTDANGVTRTGIDGFLVYLIPNFEGMTLGKFVSIVVDAMGQLFFSISVAMGIMVTYGSYVKKDTNLIQSVNHIEIFDTAVAFLAGLMIIPAVYTFMGTEGMTQGTGLMFVVLPKVFAAIGGGNIIGTIIGIVFFVTVAFAALTSSVSLMETIVACVIDKFSVKRKTATILVTLYTVVVGVIVCLGYNVFKFELLLPNGTVAQILDVLDYIANYCLMPICAIATCILVGWLAKPQSIIDEVTLGGYTFRRKTLYIVMVKYIAPIMLILLLLTSTGIVKFTNI